MMMMATTRCLCLLVVVVVVAVVLGGGGGGGLVWAKPGGVCTPSTGREPAPPRAEDGIFFVQTAEDIDNLVADCTTLDGSLEVVCSDSSISSLEVFHTVTEVTGYVRIEGCHNLTDLNGLRNLNKIDGSTLYDIPNQQQGFALLIRNNDALMSLHGLNNLRQVSGPGSLGLGRVGVLLNEDLCYADAVDWSRVVGHDLVYRVLDTTASSPTTCASAACHSACSCGSCFGPEKEDCQNRCTAKSSRNTYIVIAVVVFCLVFGVAVWALWMCVTNRCGCRLRFKSNTYQLGVLKDSGRRMSQLSSKRGSVSTMQRDPIAGQAARMRHLQQSMRRNSRRVAPLPE
ncbi:hypothetical protein PTSG_01379 [Salpingoeca rosetta]|uniref:Receptor L-domain domain-containing protein n=1 Tax=Salpingoeca rosetta (strain ATCC 50818 / BSB-021) TaxID=946362 RepID=F2U063_SALR5|nr:uncharacterized protein PTSG_01379 [Salpingoeca rosetta]EGD80791.1 hypothetical protein PTSG_01379 [Salpingoeca rosetta]|eukprot:XP_004997352.1 hypothetical protein PTSG_01379 [Salpingoeca rosetta]